MSEDRDTIQELSLLNMSSCSHSAFLCLSVSHPKQSEMKATPQEKNSVLDHSRATMFQKHILKPALWVNVAALQTWIHTGHSATVTAISTQRQMCRHCHSHHCSVSGRHFWLTLNLNLTPAFPRTGHVHLCPAQFNPAEALPRSFFHSYKPNRGYTFVLQGLKGTLWFLAWVMGHQHDLKSLGNFSSQQTSCSSVSMILSSTFPVSLTSALWALELEMVMKRFL